uniref:Uncharacterized protein n=1 Tax=Sphaerodactylus townsendi TaxID=933632 RepID=A0ACB8FI71_9SAUR
MTSKGNHVSPQVTDLNKSVCVCVGNCDDTTVLSIKVSPLTEIRRQQQQTLGFHKLGNSTLRSVYYCWKCRPCRGPSHQRWDMLKSCLPLENILLFAVMTVIFQSCSKHFQFLLTEITESRSV